MEDKLINKILNPENMHQAKLKVIANTGKPKRVRPIKNKSEIFIT